VIEVARLVGRSFRNANHHSVLVTADRIKLGDYRSAEHAGY
jgi:hypothetical protein